MAPHGTLSLRRGHPPTATHNTQPWAAARARGRGCGRAPPGFDSVNPGASAAFKRTEKQLGELKRHQDELDRQKDAVQAAIEASLARLHTQAETQLMGTTFLKQTAALELDEYERTTVKGPADGPGA